MQKRYRSIEILTHFRCRYCDKWWTIADVPKAKNTWYCPWCGKEVKKK